MGDSVANRGIVARLNVSSFSPPPRPLSLLIERGFSFFERSPLRRLPRVLGTARVRLR